MEGARQPQAPHGNCRRDAPAQLLKVGACCVGEGCHTAVQPQVADEAGEFILQGTALRQWHRRLPTKLPNSALKRRKDLQQPEQACVCCVGQGCKVRRGLSSVTSSHCIRIKALTPK